MSLFAAREAVEPGPRGGKMPVCDAGPPLVVECTGPGTAVQLDGSNSYDPMGQGLKFHWEGCPDPRFTLVGSETPTPVVFVDLQGACQATCTYYLVVRNGMTHSVCSVDVTVRDTTPPTITCPPNAFIPIGQSPDPMITGMATAVDACNPAPVVTYVDQYPEPNAIRRIWTADDGCQTSQCEQIITFVQPPPIEAHLDFYPGACPNIFDISNTALSSPIIAVRVALLGNDFDVTQVDLGTLAMEREFLVGSASVRPEITTIADEGTPFVGNPCECHSLAGDGIDDIVMVYGPLRMINEFNLSQVPDGSVLGFKITGRLLNGAPFVARDCLTIVNPGY